MRFAFNTARDVVGYCYQLSSSPLYFIYLKYLWWENNYLSHIELVTTTVGCWVISNRLAPQLHIKWMVKMGNINGHSCQERVSYLTKIIDFVILLCIICELSISSLLSTELLLKFDKTSRMRRFWCVWYVYIYVTKQYYCCW